MDVIEKQINILKKFEKLVTNVEDESKLNGYIHSWNKYRNYFDKENKDINIFYNKINELIDGKIIQIRNSYQQNQFNQIDCTSDIKDKTLLKTIQNYLFYYINTLDNDTYNPNNVSIFINWLKNISKCHDISIFKPKIYELVQKLNLKSYNNLDVYNNIEFNTNTTTPMLLTDFFNKTPRNCSLLKEYECNEDCYWSNNWYDRLNPFSERCKPMNFKDLVINSYCSDNSYKSKEELIDIIKLFYVDQNEKYDSYKGLNKMMKNTITINGNKINLSKKTKKYLCEKLRDLLNNHILSIGDTPDEQISFWNKYKISNYSSREMLHIIKNSIDNKYTVTQIIKKLIGYLKRHAKPIIYGSIIAFFTFMVVYNRSEISGFIGNFYNNSFLTKKTIEKNLHNNNQTLPKYDPENENKVQELIKNGVNVNLIAGSDGELSNEEIINAIILNERRGTTDKYIIDKIKDHTTSETVSISEMPVLFNTTLNQLNKDIDTINSKINDPNISDVDKYILQDELSTMKATKHYLESIHAPFDYNQFENTNDKLGFDIEKT